MRRAAAATSLAITVLALAACGSDAGTPAEPADDETAFDPMVETIDRAKEAEELVNQRKDELDAQLDAAEGGETRN